MTTLHAYEREAAEMLIGSHLHADSLREQLEHALILNIQETELGVVKELRIPDTIPRIPDASNLTLSGVDIEFDNGVVCAAILFLKDGRLDALEIVTLDGIFPGNPQGYKIRLTTKVASDIRKG